MVRQSASGASSRVSWIQPGRVRFPDSFGVVLLLIALDYLAVAVLSVYVWGAAVAILLLEATLLFALRTSHSRRIWQLLAALLLIVSLLYVVVAALVPGTRPTDPTVVLIVGVLLVVTPISISRRIASSRVVTVETILGAIAVYLLIGFSFASIYALIGLFAPGGFFQNYPTARVTDYLFFSYTTLTTVGYGNLVPVGNLGQTFAMIEALLGQIYLVIVVARLVSLWGSERPLRVSSAHPDPTQAVGASGDDEKPGINPDTQPAMSVSPPVVRE